MGITLLHEDPSTQSPWTRIIFTFVAFVVAMLSDVPWGWIDALFCCALANPGCTPVNVILAITVMVT
jgi:hypothetical protein